MLNKFLNVISLKQTYTAKDTRYKLQDTRYYLLPAGLILYKQDEAEKKEKRKKQNQRSLWKQIAQITRGSHLFFISFLSCFLLHSHILVVICILNIHMWA